MNKTRVSVEKAIFDLREIFGLNRETKSMQKDNWFMIIKTEFERDEVISKLQEYFEDKVLPVAWECAIDNSITLLWTRFEFRRYEDTIYIRRVAQR